MRTTFMKLRIAGIAAFLLFILSAMFNFPSNSGFYFNQVQQILLVVSFVIFALLILLQVYGLFVKATENEADS